MIDDVGFDRLRSTATFEAGGHDRWRQATLVVVGSGLLGGQFTREAARSGARVDLYDFDVGEAHNRGNQEVDEGLPKAETAARRANEGAPGSVRPFVVDVRHVGVGCFEHVAAIVDCSDDPALALPLTEVSNGWAVPLIRIAVDGSGRREMGRVLVSDGGRGHACQLCASSWTDVFDPGPRLGCEGAGADRAPTRAGSALGMSVAGLGLLCTQRVVLGHGAGPWSDREIILDLDAPQILPMRLERSESCLSGHRRWDPVRLCRRAAETTLRDLMSIARDALATRGASAPAAGDVSVGFRGHPLLLALRCPTCRNAAVRVGTLWRAARCSRCGGRMRYRRDPALDEVNLAQAEALGVADETLAALGVPVRGALAHARAPGCAPVPILFD